MLNKRGQGAPNAASFVLLMMIMIVLYILFIPAESRDALLSGKTLNKSTTTTASSVLLLQAPGTLYPQKQDSVEHYLGSAKVQVTTEDSVIKMVDSAYVETSKSVRKTKTMIFFLDNPADAKNVALSFAVTSHKGNLIVKLNDEEIFNGEIKNTYASPILLNDLKSENIIEFSASSPSFLAFWETNKYSLSDIKVTGTIANLENKQASLSFYARNEEINNAEETTLTYFVDCTSSIGRMTARLNGQQLSSKMPDCGSYEQVSVSPSTLSQGSNELTFSIDKGTVLIDKIILKTALKEANWPVYYFDLDKTEYAKIRDKTHDAVLSIKFADDTSDKVAVFTISDHKVYLSSTQKSYSKSIGEFLGEGSNYIMIEPRTELKMVELKVTFVSK
jgi:hypothetical protein